METKSKFLTGADERDQLRTGETDNGSRQVPYSAEAAFTKHDLEILDLLRTVCQTRSR